MTEVFRFLVKPSAKREKEGEMNLLCNFVTARVYFVSSFFGNREHSSNRKRGLFGLILWITNLCIHFSFDFYEAFAVFHVSWLTCQILFLILYIVITVYVHPYAITWFIDFVRILSKDDIHYVTLSRLGLACKYFPYILTVLCVAATACQYVCYAADNALTIHLVAPGGNHTDTDTHLKDLEGFLNVIRFTSIVHIFYTSFCILFLICAIFFSLINSQKEFNKYLGEALASHPATLTLKGAIGKFDGRCKILKKSSENMSVILSYLILTTSASCVVNAYNFLFIKRYAIYVWFSVAPLLWTVVPLIGAAMVTSCYQQIKFIVLESWMQIPDRFDEQWNPYEEVSREQPRNNNCLKRAATLRNRPAKYSRTGILSCSLSEPCLAKHAVNDENVLIELNEPDHITNNLTKEMNEIRHDLEQIDHDLDDLDNEVDLTEQLIEENNEGYSPQYYHEKIIDENESQFFAVNGDVIKASESLPVIHYDSCNAKKRSLPDLHDVSKSSKSLPIVNFDLENDDIELSLLRVNATSISSSLCNISQKSDGNEDGLLVRSKSPTNQLDEGTFTSRKTSEIHNEMIIETQKKLSTRQKPSFCTVARTIQATKKFESIGASKRKFNYEKYLRVLEHTLDHTGFRIGKVRITWQRVDFIFAFLFSLVMMFAESAIL